MVPCHVCLALLLLTALSLLLEPTPTTVKWAAAAAAAATPPGVVMEEKIRLGSTPPSCLNRCNACNPCMAVQVPTLPGKEDRAQPGGLGRKAPVTPMADGGGSGSYRGSYYYPYYKPLGWKCRCRDHLFNPCHLTSLGEVLLPLPEPKIKKKFISLTGHIWCHFCSLHFF